MNKNNNQTEHIEHQIFSTVHQKGLLNKQQIFSHQRIHDGLLNFTYRIFLKEGPSVILKYYPPFIATLPDIPLSSSRAFFERQALKKLPNVLECSHTPMFIDGTKDINIMEDKGKLPSLQLQHTPQLIQDIAIWLGKLHESAPHFTAKEKQSWKNKNIQESRHENQYKHLASIITNPVAQKHLYELGEFLQESGFCPIMGDLWPSSILIQDDTFFVIDWEFSHYGRPLQDVAHLCAHLVLMKQPQYCSLFLQTYIENVSTKIQNDVLSYRATHHYCAEILMRSIGLFQNPEHKDLKTQAVDLLTKHPHFLSVFST